MFDFPALVADKNIDLSPYSNRQKIEIMEWVMAQSGEDIADELPVIHNVHAGMYDRRLFVPQGVVLTGKVHLKEHIFILAEGVMSVITDNEMQVLTAPAFINCPAGSKKIGYAHEHCICTTIHVTDNTDIESIELELFEDSDLSWIDAIMKPETKRVEI